MLKKSLGFVGAVLTLIAPTAALAYDPPTPPFRTTTECDLSAQRWAKGYGPVGSPAYNSAYYDYYFDNCPDLDA